MKKKRQSMNIKSYHLAKSEATFFTAFIHTLAVLAVTTLNRHHILPVDDLHEKHLFLSVKCSYNYVVGFPISAAHLVRVWSSASS